MRTYSGRARPTHPAGQPGGRRYDRLALPRRIDTHVLVVGAGLAGLYAALRAAHHGCRVTLATKGALRASNSFWAQGGIAAAVAVDDNPDCTSRTPRRRRRPVRRGGGAGAVRGRRAAHLRPRGVRHRLRHRRGRQDGPRPGGRPQPAAGAARRRLGVGPAHGRAADRARARRPRITCSRARPCSAWSSDGEACGGAFALHRDELLELRAGATILATGGVARSGPAPPTRRRHRRRHRAGVPRRRPRGRPGVRAVPPHRARGRLAARRLPAHGGAPRRGRDAGGRRRRRIMEGVHPQGDLAPRDVVARAIDAEPSAAPPSTCRSRASTASASRPASRTSWRACARPARTSSRAASRSRPPRTTRWAA